MDYTIEQFPKNKEFANLSEAQKELRRISKKKEDDAVEIACRKCHRLQPLTEYYVKYKGTPKQRRDKTCRDCRLGEMGVVQIGQRRYNRVINLKGLKECKCCKEIKPLSCFGKNAGHYLGVTSYCKECMAAKRENARNAARMSLITTIEINAV